MNPREESPATSPILSLGRYALFGELATGGMATVHFGRMSSLGGFNRTVAIKRMRSDIARDPEFVAMFLDEARLTSRIEHPNVVATLDVVAESGEVFLVMEYVRGESLQRLRRAAKSRREKVPVPVAVSVMVGALAGLHAAHEAVGENGVPLGIIHRDVSPQNIMVGEDGIARITDFGIAKAESRLQVTHEGQMKGKLPYMAPEQLGSSRKKIDRRVDIFSAAVVLWELLAGKGLFRADHPGETIAKVLSAPIPALAPYRSDVTAALDRALRRALSRNPDQRPQTAEEFASELEDAIDSGPASPRVVGAWVSSLAGDVLANRMKYVREMESTSFNVVQASLPDPRASKPDASSGPAVGADPEPDLKSDPSMPRVGTSPIAVPPPPTAAVKPPRPVLSSSPGVPPPPPVVRPPAPSAVRASSPDRSVEPPKPPPGAAAVPAPPEPARPPAISKPDAAGPAAPSPAPPQGTPLPVPPPVFLEPPPPASSPDLAAPPVVSDPGSSSAGPTPPSGPNPLPAPTLEDDPAMPSESSMPFVPFGAQEPVPTSPSLSIPPFRKNRWMPFAVAGVLVAVGGVILVVALAGGGSGTAESDVTGDATTATVPAEPVPSPVPTNTQTAAPAVPEAVEAGTPAADETQKDAATESSSSETETKGGSSGTSTGRPVHVPPASTTGTGTRPYLPDMP